MRTMLVRLALGASVSAAALGALAGSGYAEAGGAGTSGPGADRHYFRIHITSTGTSAIDYGRDRERAGNDDVGVDGKITTTWEWQIRAVGESVGDRNLHSTEANFRGSSQNAYDEFVSWDNIGGPHTTPLCTGDAPGYSYTRHPGDNGGSDPTPDPDWVGNHFLRVDQTNRGLKIDLSRYEFLVRTCYHGLAEGLLFSDGVKPNDARIPRGGFNPRSDPEFSHAYPSGVDPEAQAPHGGDPHQIHTSAGASGLTVSIESVTEKKADKLDSKFSEPLAGNVVTYQP